MAPSNARPRALVIGPLPPPFGGVGVLVDAILRSPLAGRWDLEVFNLSKPQQEGRPSTVTAWDILWTLWHLVALPPRLLVRRPDVALVQSTADTGFLRDLALLLELRACRVPVVLHWHGWAGAPQFPGPPGWRQRLFRFGASLARRFIVLAEPDRAFFAGFMEESHIACVPNFARGSHFDAVASAVGARRDIAAGVLRVLFVGRLGPLKGTDVLLAALARLRAEGMDVTATLVGEGETPTAAEALRAHPLVQAGHVHLTGRLGEERLQHFATADVLVLPTRTDSFPLVVLEGMAAGLPVVASSVGAIPWILDHGACGALVPPGDADALAGALRGLAQDPGQRRRQGQAAHARQRLLFDEPVVAAQLDRVLAEACRHA